MTLKTTGKSQKIFLRVLLSQKSECAPISWENGLCIRLLSRLAQSGFSVFAWSLTAGGAWASLDTAENNQFNDEEMNNDENTADDAGSEEPNNAWAEQRLVIDETEKQSSPAAETEQGRLHPVVWQ